MKQIQNSGQKRKKSIWETVLSEILFGFFMAVSAFRILPLSTEIAGVLTAFFGVLAGVFGFILLKKILKNHRLSEIPLCLVFLILYLLFPMPFSTYIANGVFLGSLAGYLLAVQICYLSQQSGKAQIEKKTAFWYLFGLIAGILLK